MTKESAEEIQRELDEIIGDSNVSNTPQDDNLVALRQMPAPYFALDTLLAILSVMTRNIQHDDSNDSLNMVRYFLYFFLENN